MVLLRPSVVALVRIATYIVRAMEANGNYSKTLFTTEQVRLPLIYLYSLTDNRATPRSSSSPVSSPSSNPSFRFSKPTSAAAGSPSRLLNKASSRRRSASSTAPSGFCSSCFLPQSFSESSSVFSSSCYSFRQNEIDKSFFSLSDQAGTKAGDATSNPDDASSLKSYR
jgi:hypothetical protein